MRRELRLLPGAIAIVAVCLMLVVTGCSRGKTTEPDENFESLKTYLTANNLDLPDILNGWIIAADTVNAYRDDYYIMDIRKQVDYDSAHIEGAVHSSLTDIVTDAANNGGNIIVVACYTGQGAGHAVAGLRLSGYPDAKVLKFGMSSWNSRFDKWTSKTGDAAVGHEQWKMDAVMATPAAHAYPSLSTTATSGAAILSEQVAAMLTGGFKGIVADTVLNSPGNYFINNYWALTDVETYGHIAGAYRIKETLSFTGGDIDKLDLDKTIVTYCWTGQTSSVVTAYLTVLGYNATSLKFGANAMIYSSLEKSKWSSSGSYTFVTQ